MVLATRLSIRSDVKPFSTFQKKLSVNPESETITLYDIDDFLYVKTINFKQVKIQIARKFYRRVGLCRRCAS